MRRPAILANLGAASVAAGILLLRAFPPNQFSFYPQCPILHFFHLYCPGCGATRALAALTHARFGEALFYNPLITLLLPALLFYFALAYRNAVRNEEFRWPAIPLVVIQSLCATAIVFAAARNVFHFSL